MASITVKSQEELNTPEYELNENWFPLPEDTYIFEITAAKDGAWPPGQFNSEPEPYCAYTLKPLSTISKEPVIDDNNEERDGADATTSVRINYQRVGFSGGNIPSRARWFFTSAFGIPVGSDIPEFDTETDLIGKTLVGTVSRTRDGDKVYVRVNDFRPVRRRSAEAAPATASSPKKTTPPPAADDLNSGEYEF